MSEGVVEIYNNEVRCEGYFIGTIKGDTLEVKMEHPANLQKSVSFADFLTLQRITRETLREAYEKRKGEEYKLLEGWEPVISKYSLDKSKILDALREMTLEESAAEYMVKTLREFYFVFEEEVEQILRDEDFCVFYKKNGEMYRKAYHLEKIEE